MPIFIIDLESGKKDKVKEILSSEFPGAEIKNQGKNGDEISLNVFSPEAAIPRAKIDEIIGISRVLWQSD